MITRLKKVTLSKWQLHNIAAAVLGVMWRTASCMKRQVSGATCVHRADSGRAYYTGVQACGSVWACPICAQKIAARRRDEISKAIEGSGYSVMLVTWTIQHTRKDRLKTLIDDLKAGQRYTLNGYFRKKFYNTFGVAGYIRALEIRVNPTGQGWHPHSHELLFVRSEQSPDEIKAFLLARYGKYLERKGYLVNEHTLDVRTSETVETEGTVSDYLTKSPIELEITGGNWKNGRSLSPFQLLAAFSDDGDMVYADLFREYAEATRGKKWLVWARGLRAELLPDDEEETDEEAAAAVAEDEDEIVLMLNRDEWRRVCMFQLRGELLAAASAGDDLALWLGVNRIRPDT